MEKTKDEIIAELEAKNKEYENKWNEIDKQNKELSTQIEIEKGINLRWEKLMKSQKEEPEKEVKFKYGRK